MILIKRILNIFRKTPIGEVKPKIKKGLPQMEPDKFTREQKHANMLKRLAQEDEGFGPVQRRPIRFYPEDEAYLKTLKTHEERMDFMEKLKAEGKYTYENP